MPLLLAAAVLVAAASCALPRSVAPASSAVRVLVLNMHAGADARGVSNLARVGALVRESRADLVLLQEVDSVVERSGRVDQLAELRRLTGYSGVFGGALTYQGGRYGVGVLARGAIVASRMIVLPVSPSQQRSGGSYEPRGALQLSVSLGGGTVRVLNTHLDPSGDDRYRRQESRTLVDTARALAAEGALVLVGGDFNSTPESRVQAELRAAGLRDLWPGCGQGDGFTYPADRPVKRIDYLYALGGVRCEEARVIESDASDHRGVLFTLRLPARGGAGTSRPPGAAKGRI